ncbi:MULTISPECIES: hypothetical protein [unclassified Rhodanobacter]|uniref:hypothetical protein n=1 Tax=unclassified Rhodanobacter TaxID=2621553 RepID=UPI001BE10FFB|nr:MULTISPECIES: hypothetical protein [unclassified Rhodanobacter]MBT2144808.1 hypothetical protein [Rhodanobacter sp. LX-99]MBT2148853.1 hypothetical protein [Rhodanobacter sp. LX-100]
MKQLGSHFVTKLDSSGNTLGVLGLIRCRSTSGRPTPPQPHNGFNTAYTPFGNGHVLALSLGGTDDPRNIVPQWEQWQQTGAWRKVEEQCERFDGHLFRCDIAYDSTAVDNYAANQQAFAAHPLVGWTHPGLPVSFCVRTYSRSDAATELAGLNSDHAYDALLLKLDAAKAAYDSGALGHAFMPPEDRAYWQDQVIAREVRKAHADFESAESSRVTTTGKVLVSSISFTNFVLHPDTRTELQGKLGTLPGFSATEVSGLQVERVLKATHKLTSKAEERVRKLFKARFTNPDDSRKKRMEDTIARQKNARELRIQKNRGPI